MKARAGFTLIEVLAVMFLTGIVLTVALSSYVDLSHSSSYAAERTRRLRSATAILDRVAGDFEGAMLVRKPADLDPLAHPWVFLAESHWADGGSDFVKFPVRNHTPHGADAHESDFAVVTYTVEPGDGDTFDLLRWTTLQLPESLDREFPRDFDQSALLAEGLSRFAVRFQNEDGEWRSTWDSSTILDSSELPRAVEIQVAIADPSAEDGGTVYRRIVPIRVRPLDLAVLFNPQGSNASGGGDDNAKDQKDGEDGNDGGDESGSGSDVVVGNGEQLPTVAECVAIELVDTSDPSIASLLDLYYSLADQPFATYRTQVPVQLIRAECL